MDSCGALPRVATGPDGILFLLRFGGVYRAMDGNTPHFVLFSETSRPALDAHGRLCEGWRFTLQSADGDHRFVAGDLEPGTHGERLELLAVVRGLEALDQPSQVTLVTRSRYVSRGLTSGLETWRSSGWRWDRFDQLAPVKNRDLWQRVDRALRFHTVECRRWRLDGPHGRPDVGGGRPPGEGVGGAGGRGTAPPLGGSRARGRPCRPPSQPLGAGPCGRPAAGV